MTQTLNPTLAGAVLKAERGIAFLGIPGATSDHLRSAMDCFKSAGRLAASHHTVLVELEDQVPDPGMPLFDGTGEPAPGAAVASLGLRTEEHPVLTMDGETYSEFNSRKKESLEEEMLFALRLHARARGLDYFALRDLVMDELGGFDQGVFLWLAQEILTSGSFDWPHKCEDCQCLETPNEQGTLLCWSCKNKREQVARAKAKKEEKKATKALKASKAPGPPRNPLEVEPGGEEGGDA